MRFGKYFVALASFFFLLTACKSKQDNAEETVSRFDSGTIHISCDESFKPVIDAQIAVYQSIYPQAHIIAHYKAEAECIKDFLVDSIRMVIITRRPSAAEEKMISDSLSLGAESLVVAKDVVAVIVNRESPDSFFNMQDIKNLLTAKSKENLIPVFDGVKATSTVRFMLDSVLRGDSLSKNVVAAENSLGVIDYVTKVKNAVGFVGFSWIGNSDDTLQLAYRKKLKVAFIESTDSVGGYIQPTQYFLYSNSYPMVRDLVYVLKEKGGSLGHGFANFLQQIDKGQLIFRRSYLLPVIRPNYIRDAKLNEKINNR